MVIIYLHLTFLRLLTIVLDGAQAQRRGRFSETRLPKTRRELRQSPEPLRPTPKSSGSTSRRWPLSRITPTSVQRRCCFDKTRKSALLFFREAHLYRLASRLSPCRRNRPLVLRLQLPVPVVAVGVQA